MHAPKLCGRGGPDYSLYHRQMPLFGAGWAKFLKKSPKNSLFLQIFSLKTVYKLKKVVYNDKQGTVSIGQASACLASSEK